MDERLFGLSTTALTRKKIQKSNPHRDSGSVQQLHPENKMTGIAKSDNNMSPSACFKSGVNTTADSFIKKQ